MYTNRKSIMSISWFIVIVIFTFSLSFTMYEIFTVDICTLTFKMSPVNSNVYTLFHHLRDIHNQNVYDLDLHYYTGPRSSVDIKSRKTIQYFLFYNNAPSVYKIFAVEICMTFTLTIRMIHKLMYTNQNKHRCRGDEECINYRLGKKMLKINVSQKVTIQQGNLNKFSRDIPRHHKYTYAQQ